MLKNLKKEKLVRICPRCGSKNVEKEVLLSNVAQFYVCRSCGFGGSLFPEVQMKYARKIKETPTKYTTILAPTKKPLSIPLIVFALVMATIICILLIIFS